MCIRSPGHFLHMIGSRYDLPSESSAVRKATHSCQSNTFLLRQVNLISQELHVSAFVLRINFQGRSETANVL